MKYHIVFTTNMERDLKRMAVALRSIVAHCPISHRLHVHIILTTPLLEKTPLLTESWRDLDLKLSYHCIKEVIGEREKELDYGYWLRVWLERFLPEELDRVLYLDCDIMAHADVTELWQTDLGHHVLAAVWDPGYRLWNCRGHLAEYASLCGYEYSQSHPYFNSGVLFLNLRRWREQRVGESLDVNFRAHRENARWHDQDELNLLLEGQVLALSPTWNLVEYLRLFQEWDYDIYEELGEPKDYFEAKIRHFAGESKPDGRLARSSHKRLYYDYLDQTAWRGWRSSWEQGFFSTPLAKLIEFHYLCRRGLGQGSIRNLGAKLSSLVWSAPYVLPLYILVPLNRIYRSIRARLAG